MPRAPRIQHAPGVHHVTARGNNRAVIFLDDEDRRTFVALLRKTTARLRWRCHAYCLMSNHYHLVLETPACDLSAGMQHMNGVYAQRFNERHNRTGHVFGGRFWSMPIESDERFAATCDYVVQNPVRAGLCESSGDWTWSGGAWRAGAAPPLSFLDMAGV